MMSDLAWLADWCFSLLGRCSRRWQGWFLLPAACDFLLMMMLCARLGRSLLLPHWCCITQYGGRFCIPPMPA